MNILGFMGVKTPIKKINDQHPILVAKRLKKIFPIRSTALFQ